MPNKLADLFQVSQTSAAIQLSEVGIKSRLSGMSDYDAVFDEFKRGVSSI